MNDKFLIDVPGCRNQAEITRDWASLAEICQGVRNRAKVMARIEHLIEARLVESRTVAVGELQMVQFRIRPEQGGANGARPVHPRRHRQSA